MLEPARPARLSKAFQEARDHTGVKLPLLAQELSEQRNRQAGEVIICVEVLPRALQNGEEGMVRRWRGVF